LWLTENGAAQIWQVSFTQVMVSQPSAPTDQLLIGLT